MKDHDTEPGPFSAPAASERPGVPEPQAQAPVPEDGVEVSGGSEVGEGGVNAKARGEEAAGEHDEAVDAVLEVFLRGEHGRRGPPHVEPKFVAETRGEVAARYAGAAHAVPAGNDTLPSEAAVDVSFLRGEPTVRIERMAPQRARRRALIAVLLGSLGVAVAIAFVPWGGSASSMNPANVAPPVSSSSSNVATEALSASAVVSEAPSAEVARAAAPDEGRDVPAPIAPPDRPNAGAHPPPTRTTSASASPSPSVSASVAPPPIASSAPSPRSPDMIPSL